MRVAIDGSFLALPPSGTGTYVSALIDALPALDPSLELRLLSPQWDDTETDSSRPNHIHFGRLRRDRRVHRAAWELLGVARAARAEQPDLLHIPHFSAPLRAGCPFVVTVHDVIPLILPAYRASRAMRLHLAVVRRTVRAARLVLTPSQAAAADVARVLRIPRERIRVTAEAAGSEFRPAADPVHVSEVVRGLGVTNRYIYNVGGFDARKNLPVLLEAFARVRARLDEPLQLVIAGSPHTDNPAVYPPLDPLIRHLGLERAVILPGRISETEKVALYQGAAVYATPSLYEGFGLTALEAMACGVPTIAANRTSLPEVVGDGGLLVEPEAEALAAAIIDILRDEDRAADLRRRALARAATFTWRRTAQLTLAAYQEVVAGKTSNARERID